MTLEQLEAYRVNAAELEAIEGELNRRRVTIGVSSAATFPYSKHTVTQEGLPPESRVVKLLKRKAKLKAACEAVERFEEEIDDDEIRAIVQLRCMFDSLHPSPRPSWFEIALKLGYRSEHTPKDKLVQYLQKTT